MGEQLHDDEWGSIIYRPDRGYSEIRWFDTTSALTKPAFQAFLTRFATIAEEHPTPGLLVDATAFRMPPQHMDGPWRDANIIPRYNRAGVRKFAFHMPPGTPLIGAAPRVEGPATFPTAYFGQRRDALAWLAAP